MTIPMLLMSGNQGKVDEIRTLMDGKFITLISSQTLGMTIPPETGETFEDNAKIKAQKGMDAGYLTLADDSGFCVESLNGQPGIFSARWMQKYGGSHAASQHIDNMLKEQKTSSLKAYFVCVLALAMPHKKKIMTFHGRIDGLFSFPPRGEHGFGYDACFTPYQYEQTFAEMPPQEKQKISHRTKAFNRLDAFLQMLMKDMLTDVGKVDAQQDFPARYGDWEVKGIATDF